MDAYFQDLSYFLVQHLSIDLDVFSILLLLLLLLLLLPFYLLIVFGDQEANDLCRTSTILRLLS
jgi:hypothetical protein